ncbi:MAG: cytochrome c biogenesis protein CcdA [Bacteroidales bacterium]|nr:thioredoxin family protein [Bacteroidales bacterium]MDD2575953.1 cytochrome c biogenesis protein CcdA [Bacteroidales bacterium]MDD4738328.1 cytochrome c biogenesis protein CcdA [Bacteroidales bacterium]
MKQLKFTLTLVAIMLFACSVFSQAKWDFKTKKINDSISELQLKVKLGDGWHIYSQYTKGTELPIVFEFEKSNDYQRIGKVIEPKAIAEYDKYAKDTTKHFGGTVLFRQKIKVRSEKDFKVKGSVNFQLCEKGSCIPPEDVAFSFDVKGNPKASQMTEVVSETATQTSTQTQADVKTQTSTTIQAQETKKEDNSMLMVFLISLGAGLLTLVTPCVFPMVPMTISFFMKGKKSKIQGLKEAFFFGGSIIFMFAVIGLVLTLLLGKDAMYLISTHWVPNMLFFIIFMLFAFSFFGMFEITLPSSWINKSDKNADKGGYLGAFFIALTTVLVSFSCTGPILGAALMGVASSSTNSLVFLISMIGFSIGFALPFTLLAMFPQMLSKMKSGSWLNTTKIVFGFLEIALGLKFLSMADLSANWGLLDRETYLVLWIIIFTLLGFYLLGKLKFKGDNDLEQIGVGRLFLSIITFSFALYMIPGLWGAPLKAISGYVPPMTTQDFNIERSIVENAGNVSSTEANPNSLPANRKYTDQLHFPTGFEGFFDLEEAKAYAKQVGKPIFIDFTGKTCANCREMEYYVWEDKQVKKILTQDYVMVALYADANFIKLPENEWVTLKDGTVAKTLGKKNHNYQMEHFNANAQPLYVLMSAEGKVLNTPKGYDRNVENFIKFLEEGKANFKK